MKRRSFIKGSSLIVAPSLVGGVPFSSVNNLTLNSLINDDSDRVLVLVQLNGGNDGLNMVIPLDQFDNLAAVRPNLYIPEDKILNVTDNIGFHPNMEGVKSIYDEAKLKIIQSVGYPNQNRSHFRSTDIWHTASSAEEYLTTGWIGRYLDSKFPNYPEDYPNEDCPHPFALTMGRQVSETCQGFSSNFSMAVADPADISQLNFPLNNELASGCSIDNLDFLKTSIQQTNEYGDVVLDSYNQGNNLSSKYADDNDLAIQLKTVARLISGGLQTKIYVVNLGGFDTHAGQVQAEDTTIGIHANLLRYLSDAICAFQDDLTLMELDSRVLGMTYSEFGRRIRSNNSLGTDHGTAAPLILFGSCVQGGIIGENPTISIDAAQNEGVPMQVDFRSVYGSVLMDWFEIEETEVQDLFAHDFQYIPITNACEPISNTEDQLSDQFALKVYPNPFNQKFNLEFSTNDDWIKISIYNTLGQELKVITNQNFNAGEHYLTVDLQNYPSGAYFIRLQSRDAQKTLRVNKK